MRRRDLWAVLVLLIAGLMGGCSTKVQDRGQESVIQDQEEIQNTQQFSFEDVADLEFCFSSGAGAWRTVLHIHEDGSFDGQYMDSNMGSNIEEYPGGTAYYSEFSGTFTEPEQEDTYTWRFQIDTLEYTYDFGQEARDGILYEYTEANGLSDAEDLYIYLPGAELAALPENYRSWVGYSDLENIQETELPFYGLYNEKQESGFLSYVRSTRETLNWMDEKKIDVLVSQAEAETTRLKEELQNAVTQADMNSLSLQLYEVWDGVLNEIWGILKENLSDSAMAKLTEEERKWIGEKERTVQEAGAEVEGGSLQPLIVNSKAYEMTHDRVFELLSQIYDGF